MIQIGRKNKLRIIRFTDHGAILDADGKDLLMPKRYVSPEMKAGDEVEVFVYFDQSERPVATTEQPLAQVGDFAYLKVAWINRYGAFMDWGLMKDLFVPFKEQRRTFQQGHSYVVYLYIDKKTGRIVGTSKLDRILAEEVPENYNVGQPVNILVWKTTDLGFKVIVDNRFEGLVYRDEVFRPLRIGDKVEAFVKTIRPDGKLDISLQTSGRQLVEDFSIRLLHELKNAGGFLPYGDFSTPLSIAERFYVSKKVFKRTIGALYKQRLIEITDEGIKFFGE